MKNLLRKLACFFCLLFLIKLAFVFSFKDQFIYQNANAGGNQYEAVYRKEKFAEEPYDTVFVGSSRTALGISPAYFDALTGNTKSYNFGIIAGKPPQTFDWCEELIESKPSLKRVFFELSGGFEENEERGDDQILTFFKPSVPRQEYENAYQGAKLPLQNIPLEKFLNEKSVAAVPSKVFSLEKVQLSRLRNIQIEAVNSEMPAPLNENYWERVVKLIKLAEAKGIELYFFIPPRIATDREFAMVSLIYRKLDDKYKLKVAHYDESLYQPGTSLDNSHLNHQGAKIFTELMAKAFREQNL